ncbi:MAG: putative DNA binding domain-containing protein [Prolixibacteraceae bacterium]|nr:putative DNA binding domain-containing protein [Prolixibacteraceae bacterium]
MTIPINIKTLLAGKVVESERIEFKKGWNPAPIMRTITAFANDFENLGSGYIVIGVEEDNGMAKLPVHGFPLEQFDQVQKELLRYCNLIRPSYFPIISLEEIDGKHVLVIWARAGSNRPYEVPKEVTSKIKDYRYYIRKFSSTIEANGEQKLELINLTANIPFDDRVNVRAKLDNISLRLVQQHLKEIGSRLYEESLTISMQDLCKQMNLVDGAEEHLLPKNVALLMFNPQPELFFPHTQINLVEFPEGLAGKEFTEKIFTGTIQQQLQDALAYIKTQHIKSKTTKIEGQAASKTRFNYPFGAIEEALSNAVYHRNYELREPIEVRVLPESIEIISYGGTDPSIRHDDFNRGIIRARRYRNRRIGDFLKELHLTEGKGTGIPTIKNELANNGSPAPIFDTDGDDRRYFIIEFTIHPDFITDDGNHDGNHDNNHTIKAIENGNHDSNHDSNHDKVAIRKHIKVAVSDLVIERIIKVLKYCNVPKSKEEILNKIGLSNQTKNFNDNIKPAVDSGLLEMTMPDKPRSKNQQYITTDKGKRILWER